MFACSIKMRVLTTNMKNKNVLRNTHRSTHIWLKHYLRKLKWTDELMRINDLVKGITKSKESDSACFSHSWNGSWVVLKKFAESTRANIAEGCLFVLLWSQNFLCKGDEDFVFESVDFAIFWTISLGLLAIHGRFYHLFDDSIKC